MRLGFKDCLALFTGLKNCSYFQIHWRSVLILMTYENFKIDLIFRLLIEENIFYYKTAFSAKNIIYTVFTFDSRKLEYSISIFDSSNKFFSPWSITHFFRRKNSQYLESQSLEYLGRSSKIVGPLDDFVSVTQTFVLTFRPKFKSSKVRAFFSFGKKKKKYVTKVFGF